MDDKPDDAPVLFDTLSDERAAELFRLSLGLAGQRRLSLTPLNYALCFHYFSGLSQSLHESMDQRFGENGTLDHNQAVELFQRYLTPCTDVSVDGVRKGLLHIVDEVSDTVADVSASSLQRVGTLSGSIEALGC